MAAKIFRPFIWLWGKVSGNMLWDMVKWTWENAGKIGGLFVILAGVFHFAQWSIHDWLALASILIGIAIVVWGFCGEIPRLKAPKDTPATKLGIRQRLQAAVDATDHKMIEIHDAAAEVKNRITIKKILEAYPHKQVIVPQVDFGLSEDFKYLYTQWNWPELMEAAVRMEEMNGRIAALNASPTMDAAGYIMAQARQTIPDLLAKIRLRIAKENTLK